MKLISISVLLVSSVSFAKDSNADFAKYLDLSNIKIDQELEFGNNDNSTLKREKAKVILPSEDILPGEKVPMVVLLHGYSGTGLTQNSYLRLSPLQKNRKFILVLPEGKLEPRILREGADRPNNFWNANRFCCDLRTIQERIQSPVDDVKYLTEVVDYVINHYPVDKKRVYLFGHSNGAMMAHRMACEKSSTYAAIATLAGGTVGDQEVCEPNTPISVLQIHGTADDLIPFTGRTIDQLGFYPGGWETPLRWRKINGCDEQMTLGESRDLEWSNLNSDKETISLNWNSCKNSAKVSLWMMNGVGHIPIIRPNFSGHVLDWLFDKQKP